MTRPNLSMRLEAILEYSSSRETGSTVHNIINRADPVVVFGEHKLRKGSMEIFANSYADLLEIEAIVGTGQTLLLRQTENAGMDMYFYGVRTEQMVLFRPSDPSKWSLLVEFVETAYPYDYLLGTYGWTIADALARNATILEELTEFPLISDGVEGP